MGDDTDNNNLPVPRDSGRIEGLKRASKGLSSPNKVPTQAYDVGDTEVRKNPRACDLGYVEAGGDCAVAANIGGTDRIMFDEGNDNARIDCDAETFIGDVTEWT